MWGNTRNQLASSSLVCVFGLRMEYYSSLDASQLDSETPTLFELLSANQLEELLSPSLRYILVHYTTKYPYYLLKITNRFDELNLVLRSFVEWYFLKYWQGTFTENFYGLKRVLRTVLNEGKYNSAKLTQLVPSLVEERRRLTNWQVAASVFEITGTAYVLEKLNYWYEILYPKYITNQLVPQDPNSKKDVFYTNLKRKFVEVFPYLQSIVRGANLVTLLMYLSGKSKSPSIWTTLFGINFSRLNSYDYSRHEKGGIEAGKLKRVNRVRPETTLELIMRLASNNIFSPVWKTIRFILGTFFPVAIFSLKFLEWWNNSDFASKLSRNLGNTLSTVLPPPSSLSKRTDLLLHKKKTYKAGKLCPLCHEEISNPAIIETGYVFCYTCIYNFLQNSHKIVLRKANAPVPDTGNEDVIEDEDEEEAKEEEDDREKQESDSMVYDISKGGRCPVTGRKLLGCKWNEVKQEWDIDGLRRLMF